MVTTLQNSRAQEWTWSGNGFTRQTPSEKQIAAPKPSLVYKRARYYDPSTGEFISRDPLGYVDGMSQYRAYFVPGAVDPSGETLEHFKPAGTTNECTGCGNFAWKIGHRLKNPIPGRGNDKREVGGPRFVVQKWCSTCLLYTSPSPRDRTRSRMPSSA